MAVNLFLAIYIYIYKRLPILLADLALHPMFWLAFTTLNQRRQGPKVLSGWVS